MTGFAARVLIFGGGTASHFGGPTQTVATQPPSPG
jgi:hypothetical protein